MKFRSLDLYLIVPIIFCTPLVSGELPSSLKWEQESISPNCTIARDAFSKASSEFIKCSIDNSRPITFCEKCVTQYINVLESYANLSKMSNNGTSCITSFINLDRLGIIQSLYQNNKYLWTRAKCYECFVIQNGTQTTNISDKAIIFTNLYSNYNECVISVKESEVCSLCMDKYSELQNYFFSISDTNEKIGACMDIVDLMNNTWNYWGNTCCKYRRHKEYTFITSSVVVLLGTVLFYVLAQICAKKEKPTIIEQTRFLNTLES